MLRGNKWRVHGVVLTAALAIGSGVAAAAPAFATDNMDCNWLVSTAVPSGIMVTVVPMCGVTTSTLTISMQLRHSGTRLRVSVERVTPVVSRLVPGLTLSWKV